MIVDTNSSKYSFPELNENLLKELYVNKKMTMTSIAKQIGCSVGMVSCRIKKFKLKPDIKLKYIDKEFDRLVVREYIGKNCSRRDVYKCECKCGNFVNVTSLSLITGNTKSCGCLFNEVSMEKINRLNENKVVLCGKENINWDGHGEISKSYFSDIINSAIKRNLDIDITIEYIWELFLGQNRKCAISGLNITPPISVKNIPYTASLDRIDSSKGYIKGNVQWLDRDINYMKSNYPEDYFIDRCILVAKNKGKI